MQTGDTVRFPSDQEVSNAIQTRTAYGNIASRRLSFLLGELEIASRDKFDENVSLPDSLTVEHILPDKWMEHWLLPDGSKAPVDWSGPMPDAVWEAIFKREKAKHTLGNLTLLTPSANSSYSNAAFVGTEVAKQPRLLKSLLKLNVEIAQNDAWDETTITHRGKRLAKLGCRSWPSLEATS